MARKTRTRAPLGRRALFVGLAAAEAFVLLAGWNRAVSSPKFCASCHPKVVAVAGRSVHASVPCIACHLRPGVPGAIAYLPTLVREGIQQWTGLELAGGVLKPAACVRCHARITASPPIGKGHPGPRSACVDCHGDTVHPGSKPPPARPHPAGWDLTHGRDAASDPGNCAVCHRPESCAACHVRAFFPHPARWISAHGAVQQEKGIEACVLCHPRSFCRGCHGAEIPHPPRWLATHPRVLTEQNTTPCRICHPRADCTGCHARHRVHREQDLHAG
ncbi:MAG: hypothetical protein HY775_05085 [Acidobacteria bacterium]|nr:hypothetical protein [Acidobacteriota bacterium]